LCGYFLHKSKVQFNSIAFGRYFNDNVAHTHGHVRCCQVKGDGIFCVKLILRNLQEKAFNFYFNFRENTPIVSYVKAIDIWMVYCIFIVFATLLEFTFFVWLRNYKVSRREKKLQRLICDEPRSNDKVNSGMAGNVGNPRKSIDEISARAAATFERTAKILNSFAFGFFVLNFLIFNLVYWPWLFVSSGHNRWEVNGTLNGNPEGTNDGFIDEL